MPGWMMQSQFTTKLNYFVANLQQGYKKKVKQEVKKDNHNKIPKMR